MFFGNPLSWPDELSTYLFIAITFLAASASIKTKTELKVDVLYERFPKWRTGLDLFLHGIRLLVSVFFIVYGFLYVQVEICNGYLLTNSADSSLSDLLHAADFRLINGNPYNRLSYQFI